MESMGLSRFTSDIGDGTGVAYALTDNASPSCEDSVFLNLYAVFFQRGRFLRLRQSDYNLFVFDVTGVQCGHS